MSKENKKKTQLRVKKRTLCDELEDLKSQKKRLKLCSDSLEKSANESALRSEADGKLTLLAESNSF